MIEKYRERGPEYAFGIIRWLHHDVAARAFAAAPTLPAQSGTGARMPASTAVSAWGRRRLLQWLAALIPSQGL